MLLQNGKSPVPVRSFLEAVKALWPCNSRKIRPQPGKWLPSFSLRSAWLPPFSKWWWRKCLVSLQNQTDFLAPAKTLLMQQGLTEVRNCSCPEHKTRQRERRKQILKLSVCFLWLPQVTLKHIDQEPCPKVQKTRWASTQKNSENSAFLWVPQLQATT